MFKIVNTLFLYAIFLFAFIAFSECKNDRKPHFSDFEIYDHIDTMHKYTTHSTFYSLLDVSPDSTPKEIQAAFRKKSIEWHPDKSIHPHASEMFAVLSAAKAILQDQDDENGAKQRYDWLVNEAPAWHRSAYYVKKFATAKLSFIQVLVMIFVFINISQFFGMWCKYFVDKIVVWDARRTLKQMAEKEYKKMVRKVETKDVPVEKFENDDYYHAYALTLRPIHYPHLKELLIISFPLGIFNFFKKSKQE